MDKKDTKNLDNLRERLYSRGEGPKPREHYELTDEPVPVRKNWRQNNSPKVANNTVADIKPSVPNTELPPEAPPAMPNKRKKTYRGKLLLIGVGFFALSILLSSLFILWGGNSISGENISISMTGPFTLGGGETLSLQVGITNNNSISIESATLVVQYPLGTQSVDNPGEELFTERLPLSNIASGETVNVPLEAKVFGEENKELTVRASVEYRVSGSNATFYREAEPLRVKISSSPVVLSIDAPRSLASGQDTDIKLTLASNSPTPLTDILVRAEYPSSFKFARSNPSPVSGQNIWSVSNLEPEEEIEIVITGQIVGTESEAHVINFSIGVPNERDRFSLASVFSTASTEFLLEQPFLDVDVEVNGSNSNTVSVAPGSQSNVSVEVKNTLNNPIYDGEVKIQLSGNALADTSVQVNDGYYDSNSRTITWDVSSVSSLEQILPGDSENFSFTLIPSSNVQQTPQISMKTSVRARRLSERQAQEDLVGAAETIVKVASSAGLESETTRNVSSFSDSGPVPPEVGQTTSYTIKFAVNNGSNAITNTSVVAILPSYVSWSGNTSGTGNWNYNPTSRQVEWRPGELSANSTATGYFQVSILPSASQVGTTPTLVGGQQMRATDKFTGSDVSANSSAINTRIGDDRDSGEVQPN